MIVPVELKEGEAAEPLDDTHFIIQRRDAYRFGSDAVALSRFAGEYVGRGTKVFDICSGCGIIGILLAIERGASVVGAEIDSVLCDMSVRSAKMNGLSGVEFVNSDIRSFDAGAARFDAAVCNPPFFKADSKPRSIAASANCELTATLYDVVCAAKRALKIGGGFYMVYTASRLDEALSLCREAGLMPKHLTLNKNGKTFLLRAVRGAKPGMTAKTEVF